MVKDNQMAFLELVRGGLWETEVHLLPYGNIDFSEILQLATEQGVVGLVASGMERVTDVKVPQADVLQFVGQTLKVEQLNKEMNQFIGELVKKMGDADIYAILVKGQGVAQCYKKPMWRPSGDVDFLLSEVNYKKAKALLLPLSSHSKNEERYSQHLGMSIGKWYVEIHGSLRTGLSARVDKEVDAAQDSVFFEGNVRPWMNGETQVFLPAPTEDVFLVFTHFIKHFYKEGMSLRQICDWCRLLWTYRSEISFDWLEIHIRKAGLLEEWQAFAAMAVEYMGMPEKAMPFYDTRFTEKGSRLVEFILGGYSRNKSKAFWKIAKIFPKKAICFSPSIFLNVNWLKVKERVFVNAREK